MALTHDEVRALRARQHKAAIVILDHVERVLPMLDTLDTMDTAEALHHLASALDLASRLLPNPRGAPKVL